MGVKRGKSAYQLQYFDSNSDHRTKVIINLTNRVCIVDISLYLNGNETYNCNDGRPYKLTTKDKQEINKLLREVSGLSKIGQYYLDSLRMKLEVMLKKHKHQFSDWKDELDWVLSEIGLSWKALNILYPTQYDYLSIMEFKNIST